MTRLALTVAHRDAMPDLVRAEVRAWASQPELAKFHIVEVHITPGELHQGDLVVARTQADGALVVNFETSELVTDTIRRSWRTEFPAAAVEWLQQLTSAPSPDGEAS